MFLACLWIVTTHRERNLLTHPCLDMFTNTPFQPDYCSVSVVSIGVRIQSKSWYDIDSINEFDEFCDHRQLKDVFAEISGAQ